MLDVPCGHEDDERGDVTEGCHVRDRVARQDRKAAAQQGVSQGEACISERGRGGTLMMMLPDDALPLLLPLPLPGMRSHMVCGEMKN